MEKRTPSSTLSPAGTVTILLVLLGGRGCAEQRRGRQQQRATKAASGNAPPGEKLMARRRRSFHRRHRLLSLSSPPPGRRLVASTSAADVMKPLGLRGTARKGSPWSAKRGRRIPTTLLGRERERESEIFCFFVRRSFRFSLARPPPLSSLPPSFKKH